MTAPLDHPKPLTRNEADALRVIQEFLDRFGYAPTMEELSVELDRKSKSFGHGIVHSLARKGWIEHTPRGERGIRVLRRVPGFKETAIELTERGCAYLAEHMS